MTDNGYGLWWLVGLNTIVFGLFAVSFFHPQSRRDWRAMARSGPSSRHSSPRCTATP